MEEKEVACQKAKRIKMVCRLTDTAKLACKVFESATNEDKGRLYEDFSRMVTIDRSLHKF